MQYLVHAYDYTDPDALSRRMAVRADHLAGAARLKAGGQFILGGALLSPEGQMIGSMMLFDFETEEQLQAWQPVSTAVAARSHTSRTFLHLPNQATSRAQLQTTQID